ncbi:hypothetical protein [Mammaliicoccus sciuri]|uniref:hypothetical protein n=1 Tax=Mammaliicoccus sciuri TaxID=1296 RepID=UPI000D1D7F81|nr:hypothetical protein [Mammaliicoccus sciuri]PTJ54234.1 hypothetical protein BU012_01155 [Mammaliicoccus sciuri]
MIENTGELGKVRREITDNYLREMWEEKIEPKIQKKVAKGKSKLDIKGFYSRHSTEQLANIGRELGYEVKMYQGILKVGIIIFW